MLTDTELCHSSLATVPNWYQLLSNYNHLFCGNKKPGGILSPTFKLFRLFTSISVRYFYVARHSFEKGYVTSCFFMLYLDFIYRWCIALVLLPLCMECMNVFSCSAPSSTQKMYYMHNVLFSLVRVQQLQKNKACISNASTLLYSCWRFRAHKSHHNVTAEILYTKIGLFLCNYLRYRAKTIGIR